MEATSTGRYSPMTFSPASSTSFWIGSRILFAFDGAFPLSSKIFGMHAVADHGPSVLRSALRRCIDVKVSHKPACQSLFHTRASIKSSATALKTCHTRRRARRPYTKKRCALLMHRADIQTATSEWRRDSRKLKSPATGIAGLNKVTLGTQSSLPERTRYSSPSQMMV